MKNLKLKLTFLSLCAFATAAHAQQVKGNSVLYTSSQGNMRIEMCSESMFRVTKVPAQQMPDIPTSTSSASVSAWTASTSVDSVFTSMWNWDGAQSLR